MEFLKTTMLACYASCSPMAQVMALCCLLPSTVKAQSSGAQRRSWCIFRSHRWRLRLQWAAGQQYTCIICNWQIRSSAAPLTLCLRAHDTRPVCHHSFQEGSLRSLACMKGAGATFSGIVCDDIAGARQNLKRGGPRLQRMPEAKADCQQLLEELHNADVP